MNTLYTLAEPLGLAMKADEIKSISIEHSERTESIYQYAYDTTIMVEDLKSIERAMVLLNMYCRGSGAKINFEKSICLTIGIADSLPEQIFF